MDTQRLNFDSLFTQKIEWINLHNQILAEQKEYDTIVPKKFFDMANSDIICAYILKRKLLDKNLKFVCRELKKEHKLQRKIEKELNKQNRKETLKELARLKSAP
jgi:hypothetical protein